MKQPATTRKKTNKHILGLIGVTKTMSTNMKDFFFLLSMRRSK